jgi:hypothetical protein
VILAVGSSPIGAKPLAQRAFCCEAAADGRSTPETEPDLAGQGSAHLVRCRF